MAAFGLVCGRALYQSIPRIPASTLLSLPFLSCAQLRMEKPLTLLTNARLAARTKNLEIDYTAVSLNRASRVRFRYKLEGIDAGWQDAGSRRQAFYNNLPPGKYRFVVSASNGDNLWNGAGAFWTFPSTRLTIRPPGFRHCAWPLFLDSSGGYTGFRLHQIERQFNVRLEERVGERTRIARELHDTLLQSFQGSLFEVQAARNLFPRRPDDAMRTLDEAIRSTESAIAEGRDAILDLRSDLGARSDLAHLLAAAGRELSETVASNGDSPAFCVTVEGSPRDLETVLQDALYRIGREILRNAFRHARAKRIEVEIRYDAQEFRIRFRDDGIGIEPKVLDEGARPGHWGLPGVRERAKAAGARVEFWSEVAAGTEVQVVVPASVVYAKSAEARVCGFSRKRSRSHGN